MQFERSARFASVFWLLGGARERSLIGKVANVHRLTEIAMNGDVEVEPRYQGAALRRLAAYEDMHQDLESQLENVNEKLADIEQSGSADPQANQLFAQQVAIKATLAMYEAYGIS